MTTDPSCGASVAISALLDTHNERWTRAATGLAVITGTAFAVVFLTHLSSLEKGIASDPVLAAKYYARSMALFSTVRRPRSDNGLPGTLRVKRILKPILKPDFHLMGITSRKTTISTIRISIHFTHWALINLAGPLIAIASVERMIAANHLITAPVLGSAGQAITLFSSITSSLLACWEIIAKYYKSIKKPSTDSTSIKDALCRARGAETKALQFDCVRKRQGLPRYVEILRGAEQEEREIILPMPSARQQHETRRFSLRKPLANQSPRLESTRGQT